MPLSFMALLPQVKDYNWSEVLSSNRLLVLSLGCASLYSIIKLVLAIYRLYLHPLSGFKGPSSAAISTSWLYNVCINERLPEVVFEGLHAKYHVKAVRIAPNELHITDTSLYKTIYCQTTPYMKQVSFYEATLAFHTSFAETDPVLHKRRRALLNPMFSRAGLLELEPVIKENIINLCKKIRRLSDSRAINVYDANKCLSTDIIMRFAFGNESNVINESPNDFQSAYAKAIEAGAPQVIALQYNPLMQFVASKIPMSVVARLDKNINIIHELHKTAHDSIRRFRTRTTKPSYPVIFDNLKSLSDVDLAAESVNILIAGSDTTAYTLTMAIFYILSNEECKTKLTTILKEKIPNLNTFPSLVELEKIDYLWAIIKESIRLAAAVPGRLPRVVPKNAPPIHVDGKLIPPGTIIGMSAYTMNTDPETWGPDPHAFRPTRWLTNDNLRARTSLDSNLCSFSKGTRSCVGMNIAYAEMTMGLAYLFRMFEVELETKHVEAQDRFTMMIPGGVFVRFAARED